MVHKLTGASIAFLALALVNCFPFYRHQNAACKQRGSAYAARVEKLKHDVHEKLGIGTRKGAVVRFFAENGIPLTFVRDEATGPDAPRLVVGQTTR